MSYETSKSNRAPNPAFTNDAQHQVDVAEAPAGELTVGEVAAPSTSDTVLFSGKVAKAVALHFYNDATGVSVPADSLLWYAANTNDATATGTAGERRPLKLGDAIILRFSETEPCTILRFRLAAATTNCTLVWEILE